MEGLEQHPRAALRLPVVGAEARNLPGQAHGFAYFDEPEGQGGTGRFQDARGLDHYYQGNAIVSYREADFRKHRGKVGRIMPMGQQEVIRQN